MREFYRRLCGRALHTNEKDAIQAARSRVTISGATRSFALYEDPAATRDDLREAVTMFEETERIARRVYGGAHPLTSWIEGALQRARAKLRARDTPSANV